MQIVRLGNNIRDGEAFQFVVPANSWFASAPDKNSMYSFVGCTVSPGFDFADFEIADRSELIKLYPQHKDLVIQLTRK
jgi:predicted cupin superfamily sugar epimerase